MPNIGPMELIVVLAVALMVAPAADTASQTAGEVVPTPARRTTRPGHAGA